MLVTKCILVVVYIFQSSVCIFSTPLIKQQFVLTHSSSKWDFRITYRVC